jgi:hypothetical protein
VHHKESLRSDLERIRLAIRKLNLFENLKAINPEAAECFLLEAQQELDDLLTGPLPCPVDYGQEIGAATRNGLVTGNLGPDLEGSGSSDLALGGSAMIAMEMKEVVDRIVR